MKRAILLIVLGSLSCLGQAASAADDDGFVTLFNGKDLTGWTEVQGKPGSFHVEDGVIAGRRDRDKGTAYWLSSAEKYGDFTLIVEYKLKPNGNSGIFIRVPSYKGRTSREGMEIQLRDDGKGKGKPSDGNTGAIYSVVAPSAYNAKPAGEWNEIKITCKGDLIEIVHNNETINSADMSEHKGLKDRPREGYIGLSAHTDTVMFRNVRIKKL